MPRQFVRAAFLERGPPSSSWVAARHSKSAGEKRQELENPEQRWHLSERYASVVPQDADGKHWLGFERTNVVTTVRSTSYFTGIHT